MSELKELLQELYDEGYRRGAGDLAKLEEAHEKEVNDLKDEIAILRKQPDADMRYKMQCMMATIKYLEQRNDALQKELEELT